MTSSLNGIVSFVFLVAFNFIFFLATGNDHSTAVWISYVFLHFAVITGIVFPIFDAKGKTSYESKLSSLMLTYAYAAIEFVIIMGTLIYEAKVNKEFSGTAVVIIQIITTFVFVALIVPTLMVNKSTEKKQAEHDVQNSFIKNISATLKYIESIETDSALKIKIGDLYAVAHTSPIKTAESVKLQEQQITLLLVDLEAKVEAKDAAATQELVDKIRKQIDKRNYMLKAMH